MDINLDILHIAQYLRNLHILLILERGCKVLVVLSSLRKFGVSFRMILYIQGMSMIAMAVV